jgi:twitching motility protein PilT
MSSHAAPTDPHEGGPIVDNAYEIPVGGGAMPPPLDRVLPQDAGHGLVDFSQLPPPSTDAAPAAVPAPSIPGYTPAPDPKSYLLSEVTTAEPEPVPVVLPAAAPAVPGYAPVAPAADAYAAAVPAAAPVAAPAPALAAPAAPAPAPAASSAASFSDPLANLPGLTMPSPEFASDAAYTLPEAAPAGEWVARPSMEEIVVVPQPKKRVFIDDEFTQAARARVDHELLSCLEAVVTDGASDLHISINSAPLLRVDGGLRPVEGQGVWDRERVAAALYSLMTDEQRATFDEVFELDFAFTLSEESRFRVNFYLQRGAIGGAFRLIPTEIKQLQDLGVPDVVSRFAGLPRGLVLVTGPTGSGKSTTLAALIDLVNRTRADHIVTVEDPIEFMHQNKKALVNQREVGPDTHSFANALKHVLRQDPDVILIGELRDLETISVALTAAETGHLVFATLHTQSAAATIDRVIDVYPPHQQDQVRTQLGTVLQGVVTQTLVKRASGSGRVVATEVLVTTPAIANLIREGKSYQITSMMQAGRDLGMHTLDQHLAELVDDGTISREAAFEKSQDPETLTRLIQRTATAPGAAMQFTDEGFTFEQSRGRH